MSEQEIEDPVDRRKYTRYEITEQAKIFFEAERQLVAEISDLSFEGLCVEADAEAFAKMLPPINHDGGYDKVPLRVCLTVVLDESPVVIQLLVSSIYLKPVENNRSQMGLEIVDVEEGILEFSDYIVALRQQASTH